MSPRKLLTALLLCLTFTNTYAAPFDNGLVSINLPNGFHGPLIKGADTRANSVAFAKAHDPSGTHNTVLYIDVYPMSDSMPGDPPVDPVALAQHKLMQVLKNLPKPGDTMTHAEPASVTLDGLPAVRVTWSTDGGARMRGIMYGVVAGPNLFVLNISDYDDFTKRNTKQMDAAIQAIKFKL